MKLGLFLLTIPLLFLFSPTPKKNRSFSPETISAPSEFNAAWEGRSQTDEEIRETQEALTQSYRFLGGGGQCFSFVSHDGKYVIKFFKQKMLPWSKVCPWKREKIKAKKKQVFSSFLLSFNSLSEETGILYLHLNPTQHLHKTAVFRDVAGKEHLLNLDKQQFVVQKKAELANHRFETLAANKNINGAKQAIDQLIELCLKLQQKGVHNRDPNFRSNYGFESGEPMLVDVGRISQSQRSKEEEVRHFARKFRIYLANCYPELVDYFDASIHKALHE